MIGTLVNAPRGGAFVARMSGAPGKPDVRARRETLLVWHLWWSDRHAGCM
jgi:hypothetical protein